MKKSGVPVTGTAIFSQRDKENSPVKVRTKDAKYEEKRLSSEGFYASAHQPRG
jgi:hypothetical protein